MLILSYGEVPAHVLVSQDVQILQNYTNEVTVLHVCASR
jgi:hypothetical protein